MPVNQIHIGKLFQQIHLGDETALWDLHTGYFHKIFRFVFSLTGNKELTEEAVNDTFLDIWQNRAVLDKVESPEVYLFVCAKNRALKQIKKQDNYSRLLENIHNFPCSLQRTPYDLLVSSELQIRINAAIQSLPVQCKLIFSLVKENNLKYKEVASILGVSVKTVENQVSIALKKLSQSIPFILIS
ncbi:MAG: RNA polymerase sigma-70 factor [Chitinophagaceae bacterium]|nr:RNA polymerase sigma-70 factor [Chitinophagaceae bacterium]MCW5926005.1 RNA polymerase sigma-70 factor [Chitinophagaceae bacterium]